MAEMRVGMDQDEAAILAQARSIEGRLPAALRTEHWYNDWQHAVFIILFDNLMRQYKARSQRSIGERLLDKLTVYLYVHFVCEEEGLAWAVTNAGYDPQRLARHQAIHVSVLDYWRNAIHEPYKSGGLGDSEVMSLVEDFYLRIVTHIQEVDQQAYGLRSDRSPGEIRSEIAHIAATGLPLSPNMAGANELVSRCDSRTWKLLGVNGLPVRSREPLPPLRLVNGGALSSGDALRQRLARGYGKAA